MHNWFRAKTVRTQKIKKYPKIQKLRKKKKEKRGLKGRGILLLSPKTAENFFLREMLPEIVKQLGPTKMRFSAPEKKKKRPSSILLVLV